LEQLADQKRDGSLKQKAGEPMRELKKATGQVSIDLAISLVVFSALAFLDPDARFDAYQATFFLAIMVGIIQILIAVFRLGDLTRYISESVVLGFMAGAGCLIALGQIGNLLGLNDQGSGHQHVLYRFWLTLTQGGPLNAYALGIGLGTISLVVDLGRLRKAYGLPQIEMLVTLIVAAVIVALFGWSVPGANGKTVVAVIGNVPTGLPAPHIPVIKILVGKRDVQQCIGGRLPWSVGSPGNRQIDRKSNSPIVGLQPTMPGRRFSQSDGWLFSVFARFRLTDSIGH
jgi:MFS superfamily sulfate permease-like transporter